MPSGRLTTYNEDTAFEIIERLAGGEPLAQICRDPDMPQLRTVYNWQEAQPDFKARFARAREDGFESIAVDAMRIIDAEPERVISEGSSRMDSAAVAWAKNRAELRLKLLAKWDPRRYGDKLALTGGNENDAPIAVRLDGLSPAQREAIAAARLEGE